MSTENANTSPPKWMLWTGRILSALPLLVFLPSAAMKLMQKPEFLEGWTKM